jgi:chemotaxis signal transduction protein
MEISQLYEALPGIYIFRISHLEFCINVKNVYIVKRLAELEKKNLPDDTSYLTIFNIDIPIIDISKYFKLVNKKKADSRMILIIKHHSESDDLEKTFGIMVDEVTEIVSFDKNDDNCRPNFIPSNDNPFLSGSVILGERKILLPNFSKIAAEVFLNTGRVQQSY